MESILDVEVSIFENYYGKTPKTINLLSWLKSRKYVEEVEQIRKTTDEKEKRRLKASLPAITPSGVFKVRSTDALVHHSGFMCIDIDFKDNLHIYNFTDLKDQFSKVPEIAYCGLSVSGHGLFCLIPIAYPELHEFHFQSLFDDFATQNIKIDKSCKDIVRLRGYSYDQYGYFNHTAKRYEKFKKTDDSRSTGTYFQAYNTFSCQESLIENLEICISELRDRKIDITGKYEDWLKIGFAFASLGEVGRGYYHAISELSNQYSFVETERKFDHLLKTYSGGITIGTFLYYCKNHNF